MTTIRRQLKNVVKNYTEAEVKVREATSNDPWGPSSTLMSEISDLTYNLVALGDIMRMIWKRLNDHGKNWRHVYKSLVLLDYLIKNGNEKVAQQCKEHIVAIQTLKDFQYIEENKDQGVNVRDKAKNLVAILRDDERLKQERQKALKARERYAQNAMSISSDNKVTYATTRNGSASGLYSGVSSKTGGSYSDPYGGTGTSLQNEQPGPGLAPDLEAVRPSDATEEELQVSLALMLSQQEHEEEVKRKRADQAKLELAIEQSRLENSLNLKDDQSKTLVDLASNDFSASSDPWGDNIKPINNSKQINDPWSIVSFEQQNTSKINDPWASPSTIDNKNNNNFDFDLFNSNTNTKPIYPPIASKSNALKTDVFDDFFGGIQPNTNKQSSNPWGSVITTSNSISPLNRITTTTPTQLNTSITQTSSSSSSIPQPSTTIRKTPESFLGENASLVNLDNLITVNQQRPKSTNPFGSAITSTSGIATSLSNSSIMPHGSNPIHSKTPTINPFLQNQQKGPSINELSYQQQQQQNSGFTITYPTQPLTQPLIMPPTNLQSNINQSTNPFLMM